MSQCDYILAFSCPDAHGIVAKVASFLHEQGGFITESAQCGDYATQRFFMRTAFTIEAKHDLKQIEQAFAPIMAHYAMDAAFFHAAKKLRVLVGVSHVSHCCNHLLHASNCGSAPVEIPAIFSNHTKLEWLAKQHDIPFHHLPVDANNRVVQEAQILALMDEYQADILVLARYMQVLSDKTSVQLQGRAINIHHSFLPGFKGANPYQQAYDRGVKLIGATAHYVTSDLDEGPIIEQEVARVDHSHKPQALQAMGRDIESVTLTRAVKYHAEHRVLQNAGKTVVFR